MRDAIPKIERVTGLTFKTPPRLEMRSRAQVRDFLVGKFNESTPAAQLRGEEMAYKLFGLIPIGFEEGGSARGEEHSRSHCHAPKKRMLHPISPLLTGENVLPRVAQLSVVRIGGTANLSGARMRWRIASRPSLPHPFDPRAPGTPAWDAELFRARGAAPGRWMVRHDPDSVHLVAAAGDRALGEGQRLSA